MWMDAASTRLSIEHSAERQLRLLNHGGQSRHLVDLSIEHSAERQLRPLRTPSLILPLFALSIEHSAERQLRPFNPGKLNAVRDSPLSIEHSAERQLRPDARERFPPVVCGGGGAIRVESFGCAGALRTCRSASLPCKELPDVLSTVGWLCFAVDEWRNKILWVRGDWTDVRRCPNALLQTQTMR